MKRNHLVIAAAVVLALFLAHQRGII